MGHGFSREPGGRLRQVSQGAAGSPPEQQQRAGDIDLSHHNLDDFESPAVEIHNVSGDGRDGAAGDGNRQIWTLDYQSDEDTGTEGELEGHEKTTEPYFVLETDDVIELRGLIAKTVGDFKTRGELFERCGYRENDVMDTVTTALKEMGTGSEAPSSSKDAHETSRLPVQQLQTPADGALVSAEEHKDDAHISTQEDSTATVDDDAIELLFQPFYPGDLMDCLEGHSQRTGEGALEAFERLWTRRVGAEDVLLYALCDDGHTTTVYMEQDSDNSSTGTEDEDDNEEMFEAQSEQDEEEDHTTISAHGRLPQQPQQADGSGTAAGTFTGLLSWGPKSSTAAVASNRLEAVGSMHVTPVPAESTKTLAPSMGGGGTKRQRDSSWADEAPVSRPFLNSVEDGRLKSVRPRRAAISGVEGGGLMRASDEREEDGYVRPAVLVRRLRHRLEVLEVVMGAMSRRGGERHKTASEARLMHDCTTYLNSLDASPGAEVGSVAGGCEARLLLACVDHAIEEVCTSRGLDTTQAVDRARGVLTRRQVEEEQERGMMGGMVLETEAFARLAKQVLVDVTGDEHGYQIHPEAVLAMQAACEEHLTRLFEMSNMMANQSQCAHVREGDLKLAQKFVLQCSEWAV